MPQCAASGGSVVAACEGGGEQTVDQLHPMSTAYGILHIGRQDTLTLLRAGTATQSEQRHRRGSI